MRKFITFDDRDLTVLYTIIDNEGNLKYYRQSRADYEKQLKLKLKQYTHLVVEK